MGTSFDRIKGTAKPLHRALVDSGYLDLESLHGADYAELAALHGVGKRGLSMAGEIPEPEPMSSKVTAGVPRTSRRNPPKWIRWTTSRAWIPHAG